MNVTLLKALIASLPVGMVFSGSAVMFFRARGASTLLQLVGAGCLMLVVMTHLCEALHWFPWMLWGLEHSIGHYLDLWSAVLGVSLFPLGFLLQALSKRQT